MKIAVIGGGSWGTALARLIANKGHEVSLWVYEEEVLQAICLRHDNTLYLPGFSLPMTLTPSQDMEAVLQKARCVLFAVPSQYARGILDQMAPFIHENVPIVSATKGIETQTLHLISEVIREALGRKNKEQIAVLSGPSFARELALEHPTAVSLAGTNHRLLLRLQHLLSTPFFKLLLSQDLIGVGLGGALKNVIAIAAGGCEGLGFGWNTQAILMARGLSEITGLGMAMGAQRNTFYGLSGLGDLFLTCSGAQSRNRQVGCAIGKGIPLDAVLSKMKMVAEGVVTTEAAYALSKRYRVKMPIVHEVYRILFEQKSRFDVEANLPMATDLMAQAYGKEIPPEIREASPTRPRKKR